MKRYVFIALWLGAPWFANAQEDKGEAASLMTTEIEWFTEQQEWTEDDVQIWLDQWEDLHHRPLDINTVTVDQFHQLPWLSEFQIRSLIEHRNSAGTLIDLLELQGVEGWDIETIRSVQPFMRVGGAWKGRWSLKRALEEGKHEMLIRSDRVLESQRGYQEQVYTGSPERVFGRYRFRYRDRLSAALTFEKDPGEALMFSSAQRGFDHYAGHLAIGGLGHLERLVLGDFQVQFGQGLVHWTGRAFGGAGVTSIKRNGRGIRPYASANEVDFLRGASSTWRWKQFVWSAYASKRRIDASLDTLDGNVVVESMPVSGLRRTSAEMGRRHAMPYYQLGTHLKWQSKSGLEVGLSVSKKQFAHPGSSEVDLREAFLRAGEDFLAAGVDYSWVKGNVLVFGEHAVLAEAGFGHLDGLILSFDRRSSLSLLHRWYDRSFSFPGNAPWGRSARVEGEHGVQMGWDIQLWKRWRVNSTIDLFRYSWLRYRIDAPSDGFTWRSDLVYRPNRKMEFQLRMRWEETQRNMAMMESSIGKVEPLERWGLRLHGSWQLSPSFTWKSRVEWRGANVVGDSEVGWLGYQDLIWSPPFPSRYKLKFRYAMFDVPAFDARIFAYEYDVPLAFSAPAYYGRGARWVVTYQWKFSRWGDLSIKLSQTIYDDRETVGSGWEESLGSTRSQIRVQCRIRL